MTSSDLHGFFLVNINTSTVTLRVRVGLINEELLGSFAVDELDRSLSRGINEDVRKVQVRIGDFNLMEAVIKSISEGATKLLQ